MKSLLALIGIAFLVVLSSCYPTDPYYQGTSKYGGDSYLSGFDQTQPGQAPITHNGQNAPRGYWDGDGVTGSPKIRINLDDQRAYYYKGSTLVGVTPISTGTDGHGTPRGRFKVTQKEVDHKSSLYGVIKDVETGQTIISDADTRRHRAKKGQVFVNAPMPHFMRFNGAIGMHAGFLPGYPASHGCVRMPDHMAKVFFHNTPLGTPVIVE
ncbi:L,D-transpeptidase family protein [Rubritalea tangerina]|uniref:L,D-transpeptidase family protein n=1 Tax=Rubritalea tangerina TaxID=430798 RepID=A0ABW4ZBI0_9BACT